MQNEMIKYHDLLATILTDGIQQPNRTGIDTLMIPGAMMQFDLQNGFPAITTKRLAFNAVKAELIGFIRGYESAADFRALGCNIWDANANENKAWLENPNRKGQDDLGRIYGRQWRNWKGADGDIDQLAEAVYKIIANPTDRRIIVSAWRPDEFDQMALPPCHVLYQFIVDTKNNKLNLCMYQRSCDMFLGVPFNIASASILLSIVARLTGYKPGTFTHFLADAHIYVNHLDQVRTQLNRAHYSPPTLLLHFIGGASEWRKWIATAEKSAAIQNIQNRLSMIRPEDVELINYEYHPAIKGDMAV